MYSQLLLIYPADSATLWGGSCASVFFLLPWPWESPQAVHKTGSPFTCKNDPKHVCLSAQNKILKVLAMPQFHVKVIFCVSGSWVNCWLVWPSYFSEDLSHASVFKPFASTKYLPLTWDYLILVWSCKHGPTCLLMAESICLLCW